MKKEYNKKIHTSITCCLISILSLGVILMGCMDSEDDTDINDDLPFYRSSPRPEWIEKTRNNDYQLLLISDNGPNLINSIENVQFTLYDPYGIEMTNGSHRLIDVYEKEINDVNNYSFIDGDHDRFVSIGDRIIIKSIGHVNDDGTPSPGPGEEGCNFILKDMKWERTLLKSKVK